MKTLISYGAVFIAGLFIGFVMWLKNPKVETVTNTETVTVIDSVLIPGETIIKTRTVKETVIDTFYVVETKTELCTVKIESEMPYVEDSEIYAGLPIKVKYFFPPKNLFVWEFGDWLQPRETVTVHESTQVKNSGYWLGIMVGMERVGVYGAFTYKRAGIFLTKANSTPLMGGIAIKF